MEKIFSQDDQLLAIIVREDECEEGYNFISPEEWELQIGYNNYNSDFQCEPHEHCANEHTTKTSMEVLYLVRGSFELTIFHKDVLIKSVVLKSGDSAVLVSGGHGLKFLEPSKIFEVRQGPYFGKANDKRFINVSQAQ